MGTNMVETQLENAIPADSQAVASLRGKHEQSRFPGPVASDQNGLISSPFISFPGKLWCGTKAGWEVAPGTCVVTAVSPP